MPEDPFAAFQQPAKVDPFAAFQKPVEQKTVPAENTIPQRGDPPDPYLVPYQTGLTRGAAAVHFLASPIKGLMSLPGALYDYFSGDNKTLGSGGFMTEEPVTDAYGNTLAALGSTDAAKSAARTGGRAFKSGVREVSNNAREAKGSGWATVGALIGGPKGAGIGASIPMAMDFLRGASRELFPPPPESQASGAPTPFRANPAIRSRIEQGGYANSGAGMPTKTGVNIPRGNYTPPAPVLEPPPSGPPEPFKPNPNISRQIQSGGLSNPNAGMPTKPGVNIPRGKYTPPVPEPTPEPAPPAATPWERRPVNPRIKQQLRSTPSSGQPGMPSSGRGITPKRFNRALMRASEVAGEEGAAEPNLTPPPADINAPAQSASMQALLQDAAAQKPVVLTPPPPQTAPFAMKPGEGSHLNVEVKPGEVPTKRDYQASARNVWAGHMNLRLKAMGTTAEALEAMPAAARAQFLDQAAKDLGIKASSADKVTILLNKMRGL